MRKIPSRLPRISDAEWRVMEVLWDLGEATANQVVSALDGEAEWKPKTVHTMLRRLLDKGALEHHKQGREYVYRPGVEARECQLAESRSFLDKVFDGKVVPLVAAFVEREDLSREEIDELKKILEDAAK